MSPPRVGELWLCVMPTQHDDEEFVVWPMLIVSIATDGGIVVADYEFGGALITYSREFIIKYMIDGRFIRAADWLARDEI